MEDDEAIREVPTRLEKVLLRLRQLEQSERKAHTELERVRQVHEDQIASTTARFEEEIHALNAQLRAHAGSRVERDTRRQDFALPKQPSVRPRLVIHTDDVRDE